MSDLERLEAKSIHILREAHAAFDRMGMLWSVGKDSTILLWLTRKAFFGRVPFPLIHVDTSFKIPEMIRYRDRLVEKWGLDLIYCSNEKALAEHTTFPDGKVDRRTCCSLLKTDALRGAVSGELPRFRFNHLKREYEREERPLQFTGLVVGIRADEEGSRSKERYFSARDGNNHWHSEKQEPEFWDQYKTDFAPDTHVRVHPLLDWTELNVWEYVEKEGIDLVTLYYDQGLGTRYRSLGCAPCTRQVHSQAKCANDVIAELRSGALAGVAERAGRGQDEEGAGGLEALRRGGYM